MGGDQLKPRQLKTVLRNDSPTGRACNAPHVPPNFLEAFVAIAMPSHWVHVCLCSGPCSPPWLRPGLPTWQEEDAAAVHVLETLYYNRWADIRRLPYDTPPHGAVARALEALDIAHGTPEPPLMCGTTETTASSLHGSPHRRSPPFGC